MGRNGRAAERDARRAKALADDSAYRSLSESRGPSPDGHHEDGHHDESIRTRIVDALVALAAERGYARTSVSRIVELAGVPSPIFYEVFSDRHECFLAAFDDALARASTHVRDACDGANGWRERTRRGLTALLELFEDEPHVAGLLVVDSLEAGDRGLARRGRVLHDLVAAVRAGRHEQGDGARVALTAEEVVHAALSVLEARLLEARLREGRGEGHGNRLVELVNPLMAMLVLPYHGLPVAALELTMPPSTGERPQRRPAESPLGQPVPDPRLSPRSLALLRAVAEAPDSSNRALARRIGITDEGQVSRMLRRLEQHDLVRNRDPGRAGRNAWTLSARGAQLLSAAARSADGGSPKASRGSPKPVHSSKRRGPPG